MTNDRKISSDTYVHIVNKKKNNLQFQYRNKRSGPVYTGPDKCLHGQKLARFHLVFTRDRRNWTNF